MGEGEVRGGREKGRARGRLRGREVVDWEALPR